MNPDIELVFQERIKIFYPFIILFGNSTSPISTSHAFLEETQVSFCQDRVIVKMIDFDSSEEIEVAIYRGVPEANQLPIESFRVSGVIQVGSQGINLENQRSIPWPEGISEVMVILDKTQLSEQAVKKIDFYIKNVNITDKKVKNPWLMYCLLFVFSVFLIPVSIHISHKMTILIGTLISLFLLFTVNRTPIQNSLKRLGLYIGSVLLITFISLTNSFASCFIFAESTACSGKNALPEVTVTLFFALLPIAIVLLLMEFARLMYRLVSGIKLKQK